MCNMLLGLSRQVSVCLLLAFIYNAAPVHAAGFLEKGGDMSKENIMQNIHSMLGHTHDSPRLEALRRTLQPTFDAMPKNARGGLEHRVARYALHRYFMVQHAWHIKGLSNEPKQEASAAGSLTALLQSKMPDIVLGMLEEELKGGQIGLNELVVVAASIEDLVQSDTVELLHRAYELHGFSSTDELDESQADLVIQTFTLWFVIPSLQQWSRANVVRAMRNASSFYPGWDDTMLWVRDLHLAAHHSTSRGNPFQAPAKLEKLGFGAVGQWATEISSGFGRFSDLECKEMKGRLTQLDDFAEGRVRLGKYYGQTLQGSSLHFSESPEYLRHLGALDDSTRGQSSVIIPNVLYARSNCLANSGFHSVCCMDDCQVLMAQVEEAIASPSASASDLVQAVSGLSSESVVGPRELPQHLRRRLDDIASRNEGSVPLHGRLFAQWMHYAFPNECPYPSSLLTGESQMSNSEWVSHWNRTKSTSASTEEMSTFLALLEEEEATRATGQNAPEEEDIVLWSDSEQLLDDSSFQRNGGGLWDAVRTLAMVAAVCATGMSIFQQHNFRSIKATLSESGGAWDPKQHLV